MDQEFDKINQQEIEQAGSVFGRRKTHANRRHVSRVVLPAFYVYLWVDKI